MAITNQVQAKLKSWKRYDRELSRRLFKHEGGKYLNLISYIGSVFFMEETIVITFLILHFSFGNNIKTSLLYMATFLANLGLTLIT